MIELSRFAQPGGRAMSDPIVAFDEAAVCGELRVADAFGHAVTTLGFIAVF